MSGNQATPKQMLDAIEHSGRQLFSSHFQFSKLQAILVTMENSRKMGSLFSGSDMLEGKYGFSFACHCFFFDIFAVPGLCTTPMLQREAYEVRVAAEETPRNPAIFASRLTLRSATPPSSTWKKAVRSRP